MDSLGYIFHRDYLECITKIKLRARDVFAVVDWMNGPGLKTKFGPSQRKGMKFRGKCQSYEAVVIEDTETSRGKATLGRDFVV